MLAIPTFTISQLENPLKVQHKRTPFGEKQIEFVMKVTIDFRYDFIIQKKNRLKCFRWKLSKSSEQQYCDKTNFNNKNTQINNWR